MDPQSLNKAFLQAKKELGWDAGVLLTPYSNDLDGKIIQGVLSGLYESSGALVEPVMA